MAQTATRSLTQIFNTQIANWFVLFVKLHHYHWFVKGDKFYELHKKFEEMYREAAEYVDQLAERLLAVKGTPVSTMRDFLQQSSVAEASGNETAEQMVRNVLQDYETIRSELKEGIRIAESENDDSTADLFIQMRTALEKHIWMLSAYLGK